MKLVTVEDAVDQFRELVEAEGLEVLHEPSRIIATGSTASLEIGNGQLRLVGGQEDFLLLQISHGAPDGPQAGLLELFRSKCTRGSFPDAELAESAFYRPSSTDLSLCSLGFQVRALSGSREPPLTAQFQR